MPGKYRSFIFTVWVLVIGNVIVASPPATAEYVPKNTSRGKIISVGACLPESAKSPIYLQTWFESYKKMKTVAKITFSKLVYKVDAQGMQKAEDIKPSLFTSAINGFWVGALNPKSIVFFAAILPAFVDQEKDTVTQQLLILGLIFCVIAFISDGTYGLLAGTARQWLSSDINRLIFMRRFGGAVMIGLGVFTISSIYIFG